MNIKDIARLAGVGVSTVSRVINNHPDVKQETREKITELIKENNYIPNNSARMLKQNNTNYIGVLVKGVFNPFFSEMVKVVGEYIGKSKYTMILQHDDQDGSDIDSLIGFVKEKKLKGVIYLGGNFADVPKERFEAVTCPIVLLCSNIEHSMEDTLFSSVGIDDYKAAYQAMHYVIEKGHKHIAMVIGGSNDKGVGRERLKGYLNAIKDCGVESENTYIIEGNYNYKEAYEETTKCLEKAEGITAICALSDTMAIGASKAIIGAGYTIGKDIAVMGFDGMEITDYYNPPLTTIEQPRKEIAKKGIELLLGLLQGQYPNEHIVVDFNLLERESC